jgi:hypothetical protein
VHSREKDTTQRRTIYEARAQRKNIGFAHALSKRRGLKDALKKKDKAYKCTISYVRARKYTQKGKR